MEAKGQKRWQKHYRNLMEGKGRLSWFWQFREASRRERNWALPWWIGRVWIKKEVDPSPFWLPMRKVNLVIYSAWWSWGLGLLFGTVTGWFLAGLDHLQDSHQCWASGQVTQDQISWWMGVPRCNVHLFLYQNFSTKCFIQNKKSSSFPFFFPDGHDWIFLAWTVLVFLFKRRIWHMADLVKLSLVGCGV